MIEVWSSALAQRVPGMRAVLQCTDLYIPKTGFIIPNMGIKKMPVKKPIDTAVKVGTGVADALFTKVQQRVLGVLFGNPGRSYYANELIGLAGSGTGAVQRELARLEAAGLATVTRVGKQNRLFRQSSG